MSHQRSIDDHQLTLQLDEDLHDAILRARKLRRSCSLPESLTASPVLTRLRKTLRQSGPGNGCGYATPG